MKKVSVNNCVLNILLIAILLLSFPYNISTMTCKLFSDDENANLAGHAWDLYSNEKYQQKRNEEKEKFYFKINGFPTSGLANPSDKSQYIRFRIMETEEKSDLESKIQKQQEMSDFDKSFNGTYRVAPHLEKALCTYTPDDDYWVFEVIENFRSHLGAMDARFIATMGSFSRRLEFYGKIMQAFVLFVNSGKKHCYLEDVSIFYKEVNANFDGLYFSSMEPLSYFPVITNFGQMVSLNEKCKFSSLNYMDYQEYTGDDKKFEKQQKVVELYSLALIILKTEIILMDKEFDRIIDLGNELKDDDEYYDKIGELTGSDLIKVITSSEELFTDYTVLEIFAKIIQYQAQWKLNKVEYSNEKLKADLGMLLLALEYQYKWILTNSSSQDESNSESQAGPFLEKYRAFAAVLKSMLIKNSPMSTTDRPTGESVLSSFNTLSGEVAGLETSFSRIRRSMLVI